MRKQGDIVFFSMGEIRGGGMICGQATISHPVIGESWIIEMSPSTREKVKDIYPFTHISVFDVHIEK